MKHTMSFPIEISPDFAPRQHGLWSRALLIWCAHCIDRVRQRRALARLDDRMLSDIGISRCDAEREIEKPFWR